MCGIAGFTGFENNVSLALQANEIQKHRGPDNQSVWNDNDFAFAFQRLAIIDLAAQSNQPFHKYNLLIVFNGEIYNYKELRKQLELEFSSEFKTQSDTEVLIELFYRYGEACLSQLIGMFAFAIYNKDSNELFIARDHFGIKPLFYYKKGNTFAFSSELKTIISIPEFEKEINYSTLVAAMNYLWVPGNETMFKSVHKLPPGYFMKITDTLEIKLTKYWELPIDSKTNECEKEIVSKLSSLVKQSVERHLIADVPVSTLLSGGLDSSLISVIARAKKGSLSSYTIAIDEQDQKIEKMPEDLQFAQYVAREFDITNHEIKITPDIIDLLPRIVKYLDEPIGDPAAINTFLICEAARNDGTKVLLSGMGADEIFFGYRRHKALILSGRYKQLPLFIRKSIESILNTLPVKTSENGLKFIRWSKRFISFANMDTSNAYMRSYSYYDKDELQKLFNFKKNEEVDTLYTKHKELFESNYNDDLINKLCNIDIHMFMVGLNLTYSDRASMAASVEMRVPFIDKEIVEYAMKIPGSYKYKKNTLKYILKKASEVYLPKNVIYRPKASFGVPLRSWISGALKPIVDDLLSEQIVNKRGIFNYNYVKQLITDDRSGKADNSYQIYQLITVELWFREFVD